VLTLPVTALQSASPMSSIRVTMQVTRTRTNWHSMYVRLHFVSGSAAARIRCFPHHRAHTTGVDAACRDLYKTLTTAKIARKVEVGAVPR